MSKPLPRYQPDPDPNWHTRVIQETGPPELHRTGPAGGDNHQLRGIPAIGKGVTGAIPGSRPEDCIR